MNVIVTDHKTLQDLIGEAVAEALAQQLPKLLRDAVRKPLLTRDEVKELTGWSDRTLQHLRDTRQLPFVQDGRKILYPTDGLQEFISSRSIPSRKQPPAPHRTKREERYG